MQGALVRSNRIEFWHPLGTGAIIPYLVLRNSEGKMYDWVSESFQTIAEVMTNDATDWNASGYAAAMGEYEDSDTNPSGIYSKLTTGHIVIVPGDYTAIVLDGVASTSERLANQPMHWDGTYWTPAEQYNSELLATVAAGVALATQGMTPASIHPSQIWRVARINGAVRSRHTIIKSPGETPLVVVANFSQLLGPNETIDSVDSITLIDGDVESTAFDDVGEAVLTGDNVQFEVTGGTQDGDGDPGENVIRVEVTTSLGNNFKPDCLMNVVGAADP